MTNRLGRFRIAGIQKHKNVAVVRTTIEIGGVTAGITLLIFVGVLKSIGVSLI